MSDENKKYKRDPGSCVVHDDTHEWGGMEPTYDIPNIPKVPLRDMVKDADTLLNELLKKFPEIHIDEPMNWPYR
jgi:hypothetical protein